MEEQKEEEKMDASERVKMRHTVTVGMSWFEISKQKALENFIESNENERIDSREWAGLKLGNKRHKKHEIEMKWN